MAPSKATEPALIAAVADLASKAGVSRDELVRTSGLTTQALVRASLGRGPIPVSALINTSAALNVRASDLLAIAEAATH